MRFEIDVAPGPPAPASPVEEEVVGAAGVAFGSVSWEVVAPAAAAGICAAGWGAGVGVAFAASQRTRQVDKFRAHASTTRLVLEWLEGDDWDPFELADKVVDPNRHLGAGLVVGDLLVDTEILHGLVSLAGLVVAHASSELNFDLVVAGVAVAAADSVPSAWGMPWWDRAIDNMLERAGSEGVESRERMRLRRLLTEFPEQCPDEILTWALDEEHLGQRVLAERSRWRDSRGLAGWSVPEDFAQGSLPRPWVLAAEGELKRLVEPRG